MPWCLGNYLARQSYDMTTSEIAIVHLKQKKKKQLHIEFIT